ncbi:MAG TPA: BPSS1780 family membrane protein [Burkholderiales bacterium]|jgi:uncharacterized membrane protein|nr:BPSS1780 family membrane protein [Burkholderiales bacterium]
MATYVAGGRGVEAGRGWDWIAAGWELFKKQAGMWIALVLVAFVIFFVLALIPVVGSLATFVLSPVFAAGVLAGSRAVDEGRGLEIGHLFAGFREKLAQLATVGAIYLGAAVAIALVVGLATGASIFTMISSGGEAATPAAALSVILALLIMLALLLPVVMAVWFAPALVMFHDKGAVDAMKESFSGCLRNIVPFLVYGVVMMVFAVIASIPLGLGWLVLGPVLCTSFYTSYKDIYLTA